MGRAQETKQAQRSRSNKQPRRQAQQLKKGPPPILTDTSCSFPRHKKKGVYSLFTASKVTTQLLYNGLSSHSRVTTDWLHMKHANVSEKSRKSYVWQHTKGRYIGKVVW